MTKDEVADALDEIATLLELKGENAFRCNAYRNGSRTVRQLTCSCLQIDQSGTPLVRSSITLRRSLGSISSLTPQPSRRGP